MTMSKHGVYVELQPKGNMTVTIKLPKKTIGPIETTIAKEVLALADYNFTVFQKAMSRCRRHCFWENVPPLDADPQKHSEPEETMKYVFDWMIRTLSKTDPVMAALVSLTFRERMPPNDGSAGWTFRRDCVIASCIREPFSLHMAVFKLIQKLIKGAQKEPFLYSYQIEQQYDSEQKRTIYMFRSISDYYNFLMVQFVLLKPNISFCEYCCRPFIPKTRKITKYCDRPQWNGKTCKQVAPVAMHKSIAESDAVIKAFDTTKQKLYRRYERTRDGMHAEKFLLYEDLCKRNVDATEARDAYLRGELSAEDALAIIEVND